MRKILYFLTIYPLLMYGYISNHKCKECHPKIYQEYKLSAHSKSYFTDELHRRVANASNPKTYVCAPCHMPSDSDISALVSGKTRPNPQDVRDRDGVSCFFCHTIAFVKKSHHFNINISARQAKGYKPSLFGSLKNPDESDKHSSLNSPIYENNVCKGCHSHKINDNNVTLFRAMRDGDSAKSCIKCHMPLVPGGAEKRNTRARTKHHDHHFYGIRSSTFRAKGYDISIKRVSPDKIEVILKNKMPHPMIIQPARAKYLQISLYRDGKKIWQNYKYHPYEDRKAYFSYRFFKDGKEITIPTPATSEKVNNLAGNSSKKLYYKIKNLQNGDKVTASLYARLAKSECMRAVTLKDKIFTTPMLIKRVEWVVH